MYDTCSRCDYTTYAEIPAKGHTETVDPAVPAACTEAGLTEGKRCAVCGAVLEKQLVIPALGHDYREAGRTITRVSFRCKNCGDTRWEDNAYSRNLIPGLVRDKEGKNADYTAGVGYQGGKRVLNVQPDGLPDGVSLYLEPAQVKQWLREDVFAVIFGKGETKLQIILDEISDAWFPLEKGEKNAFYVFAAVPEAAVYAETKGGLIPAETFAGVTLLP
ncbi:MAG: hypothetical protein IKQ41_08510 [Clostridia bacterium]|nr:hypothetical protein [Clostridia bacterium]